MKRIFVFLLISLLCLQTFAQNTENNRPKIGLVLAGGGAKGAAHIGVIKYLSEVGIPIDYIAGTSIGSIIGGMYALGYSPNELDSLMRNMNWPKYMSNNIDRQYFSYAGRNFKDTYLFSTPFNAGEFNSQLTEIFLSSLPSGFILGNSITNYFSSLSVGYSDSICFDDLPIPFACVATDILTGDSVILRNGNLPLAIRASMAIPGIFSPVYWDNKVLADGGLVDNFPTDVCKDMGADIIIGIDLSDEFPTTKDQLQSLPQLLLQYSNIAMNGKLNDSKSLCDIYIHPDISGFSPLSFNTEAIEILIQRGYQSALDASSEILKLKNQLSAYPNATQQYNAPKTQTFSTDTVILDHIIYTGVPQKDQVWLMIADNLFDGIKATSNDVENAVNSILGTEYYTNVLYHLSETNINDKYPHYDLTVNLQQSEPHNLAIGMRYDSEESASILLHLGLNQYRPAGWKFGIDWRLNHNPKFQLSTSYCRGGNWTNNIAVSYQQSHFALGKNFNLTHSNVVVDQYNIDLDRSIELSANTILRYGLDLSAFNIDTNQIQEHFTFSNLGQLLHISPKVEFKSDNLNDGYFPTRGNALNFHIHWRWSVDGIENIIRTNNTYLGFADILINYQAAIPLGKHLCLIPQIYNRILWGEHNNLYNNIIGGVMPGRYLHQQQPFIGFNQPQLVDNKLHIARLDIRVNFLNNHYITLMGNYMFCANQFNQYFTNSPDFHQALGFGIRYSYKLAIGGPISIDLHWNTLTKRPGFFLNFGHLF